MKKLTIVMPCYNEEKHIKENLIKTRKIISKEIKNFEIICVDDGSTDNSWQEIKKASKLIKELKIFHYSKNMGKGYALQAGTELANSEYTAFLDSDLELNPKFILDYLKLATETGADAVIASKMHKDSNINYPFTRKIFSYSYYIFLKILFKLNIKDTQTGLKLFKTQTIKDAMSKVLVKKYAFDIEVLAIINNNKGLIVDAPIDLIFTREHAMGRIKIKDIFCMFKDTLAIFYRLKILKYYDRSTKKMKELYFFIGTEAELMKMYKVILEAQNRGYATKIVSTGQNDIEESLYLKKSNSKIDIKLFSKLPERKNIKNYLKWIIDVRKNGIKYFKNKKNNNILIVVHGDTLTTLVGSQIAKKSKIKYVHVESGLRSHNWFSPFPEEIDRYFASKYSEINFCPKEQDTLYAEKHFKGKAVNTYYNTGIETLYDTIEEIKNNKDRPIIKGKYFLCTIHRQENLMNETFLKETFERIIKISEDEKCVFIYHAQTKEALLKIGIWKMIEECKSIEIIERQSYRNFVNIVLHADFVIGDGCGNQQEFYYLGKPFLIMRTDVEKNSEGLNKNAKTFENNFDNIEDFAKNYKKYKQKKIIPNKKPSIIIMNEIDAYVGDSNEKNI